MIKVWLSQGLSLVHIDYDTIGITATLYRWYQKKLNGTWNIWKKSNKQHTKNKPNEKQRIFLEVLLCNNSKSEVWINTPYLFPSIIALYTYVFVGKRSHRDMVVVVIFIMKNIQITKVKFDHQPLYIYIVLDFSMH